MAETQAVRKEPPKKVPVLMPEKMGLAEHKRHDWVVDVDPKRTVEEVIDPAFWAHVAPQMEPLDKIEVRWEDGSKILHLRVQWCERAFAKVKVVATEDLGEIITEAPASSQRYEIAWKGPSMKFAVIRKNDREIMASGFKDRSQASAWIADNDRP